MEVKTKDDLIRFSTTQLSKMVGLPQQDAQDVSKFLLSFQTEEEVLNYLNDFLGPNSPFTSQFISYEKKLSLFKVSPSLSQGPPIQSSSEQPKQLSKNQLKKQRQLEAMLPRVVAIPNQAVIIEKSTVEEGLDKYMGQGIKKKKFIPENKTTEYEEFFDPDAKKKAFAQPILIKKKKDKGKDGLETKVGQQCGCQGTLHPFVNNCLNCGRIACEVECEGPCFFCGHYIVYHDTIEGQDNKTQLVNGIPKQRESVIANKSMIYDDQSDYYNFNDTWLSADEKIDMRKKEAERASREDDNKKKFTIDFGGRKILATENESFEKDIAISMNSQQQEKINYMTSEDFRKMRVEHSKKEPNQSQIKKKQREALNEVKGQKRLQSDFFPEEADGDTSEPPFKKNSSLWANNESVAYVEKPLSSSGNLSQPPQILPPGLIYKEKYISKKEEQEFVKLIDNLKWDTDLSRRTQQYEYKYDYQTAHKEKEKKSKSRLTKTQPSPEWLQKLCTRLHDEGFFGESTPNQVIINEYTPGQGIAPHLDHKGSFGDIVVSLSLLSSVIMDFQHLETKEIISVLLHPCSLVVLAGDSRNNWTHGIKAIPADYYNGIEIYRKRRISLTFRTVLVA